MGRREPRRLGRKELASCLAEGIVGRATPPQKLDFTDESYEIPGPNNTIACQQNGVAGVNTAILCPKEAVVVAISAECAIPNQKEAPLTPKDYASTAIVLDSLRSLPSQGTVVMAMVVSIIFVQGGLLRWDIKDIYLAVNVVALVGLTVGLYTQALEDWSVRRREKGVWVHGSIGSKG